MLLHFDQRRTPNNFILSIRHHYVNYYYDFDLWAACDQIGYVWLDIDGIVLQSNFLQNMKIDYKLHMNSYRVRENLQ